MTIVSFRSIATTLCLGVTLLAPLLATESGLQSFDTGYTITKVRSATENQHSYVVASTYEGTVLGIGYDGTERWRNALSGFMNHDVWCEDITGDGSDEILAANADGAVYCLSKNGDQLWQFRTNNAPMYAVCVIHDKGTPYVVCGGFDNCIYYLSATGKLVKKLPSSGYSIAKPWGKNAPPAGLHMANFLRPIHQPDGNDVLLVHGSMNGMQDRGVLYFFQPLKDKPFKTEKAHGKGPVGDLRIVQPDKSGNAQILLGSSSMIQEAGLFKLDLASDKKAELDVSLIKKSIDNFGYRVLQAEYIPDRTSFKYFILFGARILLAPPNLDVKNTEVLTGKNSFNDLWRDAKTGKIILASSQSGGSCIHIIDPTISGWKAAYEALTPPGKIAAILTNTKTARDQLDKLKAPTWERQPLPVYLMSENTGTVQSLVDQLESHYASPVFLNGFHSSKAEHFDRAGIANKFYRERHDRRRTYSQTQEEVLSSILPNFSKAPGIAYWAGHGNDPYMYSLDTTTKVIDAAKGKKTVLIYPELENHSKDFAYVLEDLIYPLAKHAQGRNANIYIRTKDIFWQGPVYLPLWNKLMSGEFADVFVPSMEETSDKSMDLSIAGRLGLWASGAVHAWGSRCARDNPSFDRSRQHSHQMLPNHFLRMMVYHVSSGAQYLDNFTVDQKYMSFLWELIAKGALYIPKRDEIVSFSPIHLSMKTPDEHYLEEGTSVKWCTFYNEKTEKANPMVFSHLNGSWPGAPVTSWDFSRYAAGVKDRRLNFLPPYPNGMVLITPPQNGVFADLTAPRGKLTDHLHPLYRNILKEYITDGRNYYSADGKTTYTADQYYKQIESEIKAGAQQLPLTVSGDVAWVCAQTAPNHLRLTLIDSGYLNPSNRIAVVSFHTAEPLRITDILSQETFDLTDPSSVKISIPCGLFRFIDIELSE